MDFHVYILRCADDSYYCGHTEDLETRIASHRVGLGGDYTARRQPVTFEWSERFPTRHEALAAERQIKGWSRAKKQALIKGDWDSIRLLARNRSS